MKLLSKRARLAAVLSAAVVGFATSASAITISGLSIATNAGNSANTKTDTTTDYREIITQRTVLDSGGSAADTIGSGVNAATRYAAVVVSDQGALSSKTITGNADYKISFTVSAGAGIVYDLTIQTSALGALTTVEDSGTSNQATAAMSAITGKLGGVNNGALSLAAPTSANGGSDNKAFSLGNVLVLSGLTGSNVITLDFSWSMTADSQCSGLGCSVAGVDEAAVRLGLTGTGAGSPGTTADDYPGVGGRTIGNDGHFVNISALVTVPEPGTTLLLGLGLAGLALRGRRRA